MIVSESQDTDIPEGIMVGPMLPTVHERSDGKKMTQYRREVECGCVPLV